MTAIKEMSVGELAAHVCSHLKNRGIDVVLSGGGCVTLYTDGQYASYDLDFIENIAAGKRKLTKALAEIGFAPQGRYYLHPETEYFLEFPSGPLAIGSEPPREIKLLLFSTGELAALSPTDCIKDRLAAFYHWSDLQCFEQALLVAGNHHEEIDLDEIRRWSEVEGFVERFAQFQERLQENQTRGER